MKPMLAATLKDLKDLKYPVYVTPKLDGIRCLVLDGKVVTRKLKPIPNDYIRGILSSEQDLDGELIVEGGFNKTSSAVMTKNGEPKFKYIIFDCPTSNQNYLNRLAEIGTKHQILYPCKVCNERDLTIREQNYIDQGFEGIIIRNDSTYKFGRSTVNEGGMLKLKRFKDSEALIVGFEPLMKNMNVQKKDELGYAKRSSHKANKVAQDAVGAFLVIDVKTKIHFKVATGLTEQQRFAYWADRKLILNKVLKYKYQDIAKSKPRFPSFVGFRDGRDL